MHSFFFNQNLLIIERLLVERTKFLFSLSVFEQEIFELIG